jgi:HSP20 family protein
MPETKLQTSEQRGITRRQDAYPSRDYFNFDPFAMMRRLSEEMDRAFGTTFGLTRGHVPNETGVWAPAVEVREHDNQVEISAELPGLNKDDVKVEFTDEGVVIEGEKRREEEKTEGGMHRSERVYGRFYRFIPLHDGADPEKAKAEFKNGVLRVTLPVAANRKQGRRIQITG